MKINLKRMDSYDLTEVIKGEGGEKDAKLFFRGTRPFFYKMMAMMVPDEDKGLDGFILNFKNQYELLVMILCGWNNICDQNSGRDIIFSKDMALRVMENFDVIPHKRVYEILIEVWNKVAERENILKNLPDGSMSVVVEDKGGSNSASPTDLTHPKTAKSAKKKRVNK